MPALDLLLHEAVLLAVLGLLGSGFAAILTPRLNPVARLAMAPGFGLAVAAVTLTTLHFALPMRIAAWVFLLPLLIASVAVAWRRRDVWSVGRPGVLGIVAVITLCGAALSIPLIAEHSQGPMGYSVFDSNSYIEFMHGAQSHTLHAATTNVANNPDLELRNWEYYATNFELARVDNFGAAVSQWFGWHVSDIQSPLMAVLLIIGALGTFSAVMELTAGLLAISVFAGLLFVGPLFYQLYIDGSEGLIAGLVLMPAGIVALRRLLDRPRGRAEIGATGLFTAAMHTMHPVFMVLVAVWGATVVGYYALRWLAAQRRRPRATEVWALLRPGVAVGALAIVLSPVAVVYNVRFYEWATGNFYTSGLPQYHLPLKVLPGWLLQTREFFFLPLQTPSLKAVFLSFLLPAVLALLALLGAVCLRRAAFLLLLVPGVVAFTLKANQQQCSYCVQRDLIPLAPVLLMLVAVGLAVIWRKGLAGRLAAGVVVVGTLAMAAHKSDIVIKRLERAGYATPQQARDVAAHLDGRPGTVYLEAIGQGSNGPAAMEMTALYDLFNEHASRVAVSAENNDFNGLAYLGGPFVPHGIEYTPDYRWIVTRAGSIRTPRKVVYRSGPFALEERSGPFDAAIANGVAIDRLDRDPAGRAWVEGPMTFWISARDERPAFLRTTFVGASPVHVAVPAHAVVRSTGKRTDICVPLAGPAGLRRLTLSLQFPQGPTYAATRQYGLPTPPEGLQLTAMAATPRPCGGSAG